MNVLFIHLYDLDILNYRSPHNVRKSQRHLYIHNIKTYLKFRCYLEIYWYDIVYKLIEME